MPAELLVKAEAPNRGAISNVRPAGWQWGGAEQLPKFVRVTVTDGAFAIAKDWAQAWYRDVSMAVDASTATDATLTFSGSPARESDGLGKVTAAELQQLINDWTMTLVNDGDNAVTVSVGIFEAAISAGFWGFDISAGTFTDLGVVDGWQQVEVDYAATGWDGNVVGSRIVQRGCEVLSNDGAVARFAVLVDALADDLRLDLDEYRKRIAMRRYEITQSGVDAAVSNGGSLNVTESQVLANLVDLTAA